MKTTKIKELLELTNDELGTKRRDLKSETVNLRVQHGLEHDLPRFFRGEGLQ